ncbi:dolichyl-P-Man:Man(7)GlcNAc(2)-PP-dolichol alpha-1,6-mannosyltransferase [Aspergillus melleus]|uniref:dolichyl-P-Man:Man(7)GlcNAc(2)-PP-dolichol alpha-1,6-mannosyltransferase n=1 Tax=Aspergillus melleus TaxID=138277 RepID=UPI001E8EAE67|nr:alpha-1,6- mannosyltransferase [Aspergillus melleus]KAH8434890.1 alpha-1,6- mannosyltransferase [Aspergillus melleus]
MGRIDAVYALLCFILPVLVGLHLYVAPYTKVEESFHIQAIHDLLAFQLPTRNVAETLRAEYDHFTFPGAVPRTFVGAVTLAGLSRPFIWLNANVDRQFLARALLGLLNSSSLLAFASSMRRAFGKPAAMWYLLFQTSQFHVLFYASRTLSNMFAFGLSTLALSYLLPVPVSPRAYQKRCRTALFLLTLAGIIFRSELALLLGTITIFLYLTGRVEIRRDIIPAGALGLLLGLLFTVGVDSFFWQEFPLWPEFAAFKFNVLAGQASAWGTHPWHFYFTNALPRLLLNPSTLLAIPLAFTLPSTARSAQLLTVPSLAFLAIYSFQPHKEWRFIVYIIPALTATASLSASYAWTHRAKSLIPRLLSLFLLLTTALSFLLSTFVLLPASAANYPGALALHALHRHADNTQPVIFVHLGNLACQTGITRFQQLPGRVSLSHSAWAYDKSDSADPAVLTENPYSFWSRFDYVLVEPGEEEDRLRAVSSPSSSMSQDASSGSGIPLTWTEIDTIPGFAGLRILRPGDEPSDIELGVLRSWCGEACGEVWLFLRDMVRKLARGWFVEVRVEPRVRVLGRVY